MGLKTKHLSVSGENNLEVLAQPLVIIASFDENKKKKTVFLLKLLSPPTFFVLF